MNKSVTPVGYDRNSTKSGILHIGVGNFHRAHEEFYTNLLLSKDPSQQDWAITGAMLMQSDATLYKALKSQNGKYSLTICGRDGINQTQEIGSLKNVIWAFENPQEIIETIADKNIRVLSMTITEGGYNINKETGEFIHEDDKIRHDIENPGNPKTVFGFVAEGLRKRRDYGNGPITLLSCDNLQHNGDTARKAFISFFEAQDSELAKWAKDNVSFPNSMVDRITPATKEEDKNRLNAQNNTNDEAPVYCEDFIQWVIEDDFKAGRPKWEEVGVEFTNDVTAYENMKLSLLNASHTLLSYPAFLKGHRKVDEAMKDPEIVKLVRDFMDIDITPYVPAPGNTDLSEYKQTLIERFGNKAVSDQISRLCFDGISKFPVYIMPNLTKIINDKKDLTRMAYLFAAYRHYLKYKTDNAGNKFEIAEPWLTAKDVSLISSDDPVDFLSLSAFSATDLTASEEFKTAYLSEVQKRERNVK